MSVLGDWCCSTCGAGLRRSRAKVGQCDRCRRAASAVDPALWDEPVLSAALARLDFGPVFLRVRAEKDWSQHRLGELVGMDQSTLSKIERGKQSLTDAASVIRCANALAIPAGKLGLRHGVMVESRAVTEREGSWVDRRGFVGDVAGLTFGAGAAGLDLDRLLALLPHAEPTGTRHVGVADVAAIEAATTAYAREDFAQGSGIAREIAVTHLRATLPLLRAQTDPEVQSRLYLATARLATQAGWMSFDTTQHDAARRLWVVALDVIRATDHPQGSDLTVYLLADMALQAVYLDRPAEALKLAHLGHSAAVSTHPVSRATTGLLAGIQARAHAAQDDAAGCDRALGQAVEFCAAIDPATAPPWTAYLSDTGVFGHQGAAHYALAVASRDPRAANRAVPLLRRVVSVGPDYAVFRATYLPDLAGAHALAGDLDTAVSVGHQAVDAVTAMHSPLAHGGLHRLRTVLEPSHTSPGVAELCDRMTTTAT